jgi:hypothetical protein
VNTGGKPSLGRIVDLKVDDQGRPIVCISSQFRVELMSTLMENGGVMYSDATGGIGGGRARAPDSLHDPCDSQSQSQDVRELRLVMSPPGNSATDMFVMVASTQMEQDIYEALQMFSTRAHLANGASLVCGRKTV